MFDQKLSLPIACILVLMITSLTALGIVTRFLWIGDFTITFSLLAVFLSTNLWVAYMGICLFSQHDQMEKRAHSWLMIHQKTGQRPAIQALTQKITLSQVLSPTVWAEFFAAYSELDHSYSRQKPDNYNPDIFNGFATLLPTIFLYAVYIFQFIPARVTGLFGAILFWQFIYATIYYLVSYFSSGKHNRLNSRELLIYIWGLTSPWILFPILGLYVSTLMVLHGDYGSISR